MSAKENTVLWERSVQGITNLLEANMQSGFIHCLRLSYHDDARIRAIFLGIFTKALIVGTRLELGHAGSKKPAASSRLCEVRHCLSWMVFPF